MRQPDEEASVPLHALEGTDAAATEQAPQESPAITSFQREGAGGSYSFDDPDRPRWDRDTVLEQEFEYRREDGTYAYSKLKGRRSDGEKAFLTARRLKGDELVFARQERPHDLYKLKGLTSFEKGAGDEPDLLYRLDELARAMAERPDEPVFVCEGEKDADRLHSMGLIATTNPNGALNWSPEFNSRFEGRDVVVMIDNDDKGRRRAATILPALQPIARSLKAIQLPDLPPNGDVSDWLDAGRTKDDLLAAVEAGQPVESTTEWANDHGQLAQDADGRPLRTIGNARLALALLGSAVGYDEFASRYLVSGLAGFGPVLDDAALTRLRLLAEERLTLTFAKDRWHDIVTDYARNNSFHPVRDYLDSLRWDGVERLEGWLPHYAGAEDNEYVTAVGSICLIAAVRRVREPGCKFDEMLVLESEQGTNKSSALSLLAGNDDWFSDDVPLDAESKVLMERLEGRWIVELAELKGMRRGEIEHVKSMLSRRVDKARLAYGRMTTERPRQCVFFGTTNDSEYLRDMTGNRRFWPVKVRRFDLESLRRDRDQLWAEAAAREKEGASIRLPERLWAEAGAEQASREVGDPFYDVLSERLDGQEGKVRASDVWEAIGLGVAGQRTQDHNVRLSAVMQKLGWRRPKSKLRFDGRPQSAWVKGSDGDKVDAYPEVPRSVVLGSERPM